MRVIIIGAGIGGLSVAIGLRKVGINAIVYEGAPELREVGAGISLWANALRALDYLGAGQAVRARSLSLSHSELRANEGRKILFSTSAESLAQYVGTSPVGVMIHRAELVGALAELLPAGTIRFGFECVGVEQSADQGIVHFSNGQCDEADAVIGADGIHSVIRENLFGFEKSRYSGYTCYRGISHRPSCVEPGYIGEWWGRGKRFGITTLTQNRVYWFAVHNSPAEQQTDDGHSTVVELFKGWCEPVPEIVASTPPERMVHNDIIDRPPIKTWSRGCVGLVGDAAHPTTPNLGQGGCMAIEDAVAMARAMARESEPAMAFTAFSSERCQRTAAITNESSQIGKIAQLEGRFSCWLRDSLLSLYLPRFGARSQSKNAQFDIGPLHSR